MSLAHQYTVNKEQVEQAVQTFPRYLQYGESGTRNV